MASFRVADTNYHLQTKLGSGKQAHTYLYKDDEGNLYTVKLSAEVNRANKREVMVREIAILEELKTVVASCQTHTYPCIRYGAIIKSDSPNFEHFRQLLASTGTDADSNTTSNAAPQNSSVISVLVYDFVAGVSFDDLIKKHNYNVNNNFLNEFLGQMLLSVRTLHSLNIVHRDIKPSNIIFNPESTDSVDSAETSSGSSKFTLIDFGLSCRYNSGECASKSGTPNYVLPKILKTSSQDSIVTLKRSDLFAIGVCAYNYVEAVAPYKITTSTNWRGMQVYNFSSYQGFNSSVQMDEQLQDLIEVLLLDPDQLTADTAYQYWLNLQSEV